MSVASEISLMYVTIMWSRTSQGGNRGGKWQKGDLEQNVDAVMLGNPGMIMRVHQKTFRFPLFIRFYT